MPFSPISSLNSKKLSSEYYVYASGNFFEFASIREEIAILGQPPRIPVVTFWAATTSNSPPSRSQLMGAGKFPALKLKLKKDEVKQINVL
jgi:hypothetical protein